MRALLDAAKADGPSAGARTKMWSAIASSSAAGTGAAMGSAGAVKMLVGGTLLGAAATVGIAATMIYVGGTDRLAIAAGARAGAPKETISATADRDVGANILAGAVANIPVGAGANVPIGAAANMPVGAGASTRAGANNVAGTAADPAAGAKATRPAHFGRANAPEDALAREAAWLDQARSALARGDARAALHAARIARSLPAGQLLPEELTVEQQALRKLGKIDQADAVEANLKAQYPDSALAR
jgi:hypothetical protein